MYMYKKCVRVSVCVRVCPCVCVSMHACTCIYNTRTISQCVYTCVGVMLHHTGLTASAARRRSRSRRLDRDTEGPAPNNNGGKSNAASTGSVGGIEGIAVDECPYRNPSTD